MAKCNLGKVQLKSSRPAVSQSVNAQWGFVWSIAGLRCFAYQLSGNVQFALSAICDF